MVRLKGHVQIPEKLDDIINVIQQKDPKMGLSGYLVGFERLIDPLIVATLFGLFKSQELPPLDKEEILLDKSHDYNVEISDFAETLNHFLFCLWVKKNGSPEKSPDIVKYRQELYGFISKLLDADYFRNVIIPFYLNKANQQEAKGTSTFIHRMASSDNVGLSLEEYSPEYLAREFTSAQNDFINCVIGKLPSN
jgi:hypothetical protein